MVDKAVSAGWGLLDAVAKLWPILAAIVFLIGWCDALKSQITEIQNTQSTMLSRNLASRVQTLEDNRANDAANTSAQFISLEGQITSLTTKDEQLITQVSQLSQTVATQSAQITFLINKDYPGTKIGP